MCSVAVLEEGATAPLRQIERQTVWCASALSHLSFVRGKQTQPHIRHLLIFYITSIVVPSRNHRFIAKMALESFAAFSLAANILQFIEFSGKLFKKARQVHRSGNGATQEYTDLESTLERLKSLKDDLLSSASTVPLSPGTTGEERDLAVIAKDCTELADGFSNLLKKLKGSGRVGKFGSLWQAARVMMKDNEINAAKTRLKEFQTRITVCLLTILRYTPTTCGFYTQSF